MSHPALDQSYVGDRWESMVVKINVTAGNLTDGLNSFGIAGWEPFDILEAFKEKVAGGGERIVAYGVCFKRKKAQIVTDLSGAAGLNIRRP